MTNEHHQRLWDAVAVLHAKGVRHVVLCPGSRNGPLIQAFAAHPSIAAHSCVDERSAAYQALGMAEQLGQPVAVVCTSGTAALNLAPAIAEAFYQHVPLIAITADRPAEWIDQLDGQTVRQVGVFRNHVKAEFSFPEESPHPDTARHATRLVNDAVNVAMAHPWGPVHINVALREPLYLPAGVMPQYPESPKIIEPVAGATILTDGQIDELRREFVSYENVLILGGQGRRCDQLVEQLSILSTKHWIPVVGDCVSNLAGVTRLIFIPDQVAARMPASLAPELLVTFGRVVVSRRLREFLRANKPATHWHIGVEPAADMYQSLTRHILTAPEYLLGILAQSDVVERSYYKRSLGLAVAFGWDRFRAISHMEDHFSEINAVRRLLALLPDNEVIHLGNSLAVRHVDYAGVPRTVREVFSNRGTSGIDGSVSTAVGHAMAAPELRHTLIVGDLGLFYDINGLWRDALPANLRIVVLNNHGGRIFLAIDGPGNNPAALPYFTTPHARSAGPVAAMFGLDYTRVTTYPELEAAVRSFHAPAQKPRLVEIDVAPIVEHPQ